MTPPPPTVGTAELARLAGEIRGEHEAAEAAWQSAVLHGHRAGVLLLEAKRLCKHGEWLPWVRDVGIPERTAQTYMRLAGKYADSADLPDTITDALDGTGRERREAAGHRVALSAAFDKAVSDTPVRDPSRAVQQYGDLMRGEPDWAWKRAGAHVLEFAAMAESLPSPPPKSRATKELRVAVENLSSWLQEDLEPEAKQKPGSRRTVVVAGIRFPSGGISAKGDLTEYNTADLKKVADDLLRRATPQETAALRQLFIRYADRAEDS